MDSWWKQNIKSDPGRLCMSRESRERKQKNSGRKDRLARDVASNTFENYRYFPAQRCCLSLSFLGFSDNPWRN
jgi:hypothetical protein